MLGTVLGTRDTAMYKNRQKSLPSWGLCLVVEIDDTLNKYLVYCIRKWKVLWRKIKFEKRMEEGCYLHGRRNWWCCLGEDSLLNTLQHHSLPFCSWSGELPGQVLWGSSYRWGWGNEAFREGKAAPHLTVSESRGTIGTRSSLCLFFYGATCWPQFSQVTRSTVNAAEGRTASLVTFCVLGPLLQIFPPPLRRELCTFSWWASTDEKIQVFSNLPCFPTFTFSKYVNSQRRRRKKKSKSLSKQLILFTC